MTSLYHQLSDPLVWESFYAYKSSLACPKDFNKKLRAFIEKKGYLPVCETIGRGEAFSLPKKSVIAKQFSGKKRTVYTYPEEENMVLKLLTYLLLRRYDSQFSPGLYSFRPGRSASDGVRSLLRQLGKRAWYGYKADIHDYFNSLPQERLLPMLDKLPQAEEERGLFDFLKKLLLEERVMDRGRIQREKKGIMAGTPQSSFYANLYLKDLDAHFAASGIPYIRYSDDIILFTESEEETRKQAAFVRAFLGEKGLTLNPEKESFFRPSEGWIFLGFICREGKIDIAPASVKKLKAKMRRKVRALKRWQERNGLEPEKAAKAFIRIFNRKLFESPGDNDLSWSRWYFPMIHTAKSLKEIDAYAQDCLRFLLSGKRTKGRFRVRYETLKALGYRSLVHEYYSGRADSRKEAQPAGMAKR